MPNPTDLVSLEAAAAWAGSANSALNAQLITAVSRQILTWLQRPNLLPQTYSEVIDSRGQSRYMLRNWPVLSVSSLIVDHITVPPAASPAQTAVTPTYPYYGYLLSPWDGLPPGLPQWIDVYNFFRPYPKGRDDVAVTYVAGYQVTGEAWTVPSSSPYQVMAIQPFGAWASDQGVTYANGTALVAVPTGTVPTVGQYQVSGGLYTFAAADAAAGVLISYGYIPADIANAAAQWVAELVAYQGRIGLRSKSVGGQETVSYFVNAMPPMVEKAIWPYRRVMG